MTFVPCPNIVQVEMVYHNSGEVAENVYHVDMGAAPSAASMDALLNDFIGWEIANMEALRGTTTALVKTIARDLTTATGAVVEEVSGLPALGTSGGAVAPNNVTIAVKSNTGLGGRSNHGRVYHIGLTTSSFLENALVDPWPASLVTGYDALITTVNAVGSRKLVVLSRYSGVDPVTKRPIPRTAGISHPVLRWSLTDVFLDSQRRRLPAHNRHH